MDELDAGLSISLTGEQADAALARLHEQLTAWGMEMPAVEPLVLDFGLGSFDDIGLIEYWIANEMEAGYCGKFLYLEDGQSCPRHGHKSKTETFCVIKGRTRMTLDDDALDLAPGDTLTVPAGQVHGFTGIGPTLLLEISQPCRIDDNYFEDPQIPIGGNASPPNSA